MANFLKGLNPENDPTNSSYRKPKNKALNVSTKHPYRVRIIPFLDHQPFYRYRQTWVDVYNKDHTKTIPTCLTFSFVKHGDDKLRDLVSKIIGINNQARDKNPNEKGDVIPLQFKHPGRPHYNASMREMDAFLAIHIVPDANGGTTMETVSGSKIPLVRILNAPRTVYTQIYKSLQLKNSDADAASWINKNTGKLFPLDPTKSTELAWINTNESFAVYIHRDNEQGARYQVDPQPLKLFGKIPMDVYKKDSDGHYKYLDDPAWLYAPTIQQDPSWAKIVYQQLQKRLDQYKESGDNPYKDQVEQVKKNVQSGSSSESSNANPFANQTQGSKSSASSDNTASSSSSDDTKDPFAKQRVDNTKKDKLSPDDPNLPFKNKSEVHESSTAPTSNQTKSDSADDTKSSSSNGDELNSNGIPKSAQKVLNEISGKNK